MLGRLAAFYPSTVCIEQRTEVQDPVTGEVTYTWAALLGHDALAGSVAPNGGVEVRQPDQTYVVSNYTISLAGSYPTIDETMEAVVGTVRYDILLVQRDSHGITTRLLVRTVT
uniref:Head-tail joining protein n=1 Tax=viral metagenome TaxID=1070528 RepID=A0A6H1Z826_9ZZZZ